jgi:glutathione S-transferase
MDLYFSPLACSLASRITLYEAGASARFIEVDSKTKRTLAGADYLAINPLGLVPALKTDDGPILLENAAILQYLADRFPEAGLAPTSGWERSKLQQWLSFIGTELHKGLFIPLFDKALADSTRHKTLDTGAHRLAYLEKHLTGSEYLLSRFSVADAYLATVLNWTMATPVDLTPWPAIAAYWKRIRARPAVARAVSEEMALYAAEQQRHAAAAVAEPATP